MPKGVPKIPKNNRRHYFLICGTVEFKEKKDLASEKLTVNCIHNSPSASLNAKSIGEIQVALQMNFHQRYSQTHQVAPEEIIYAVIHSIMPLGVFTQEEFLKNAPGTEPEKTETEAPKSVKERLEAEVKADMAAEAAVPSQPMPSGIGPGPVGEKGELGVPGEAAPVPAEPEPVKAPLIEVAATPAEPVVAAPIETTPVS